MRILFALPYGPGPTRVRSRMILERLCRWHDVTIVALAWDEHDEDALAAWVDRAEAVHVVPHGRRRQISGLIGNPLRPLQEMVSTSPGFALRVRRLLQTAAVEGRPYASLHVEHLRGAAAADLRRGFDARVVYDAVDCLAQLAELAHRHSPDLTVRLVSGAEQWRTRRAEDRFIRLADVVTVVAERDRQAMLHDDEHDHVIVVPNGVTRNGGVGKLPAAPTAVFTGKLSYHANQAALRWLLDEVWPRVRRGMPDASLTIAGAQPPDWLSERASRPGIELIPNPDAIDPVIRSARVALAPVIYSVGIQNKVLEAMAAGRPVVTTSSAAAGLHASALQSIASADTSEAFAAEVIHLFFNDGYAEALRQRAYRYVTRFHDWDAVARRFEELYEPVAVSAKVA